jgi:hypothetical protein
MQGGLAKNIVDEALEQHHFRGEKYNLIVPSTDILEGKSSMYYVAWQTQIENPSPPHLYGIWHT